MILLQGHWPKWAKTDTQNWQFEFKEAAYEDAHLVYQQLLKEAV